MGSEQNDGTSFSPSEQKLCVNGCGFFGTAANMNLCSKCYRDFRVEEDQTASAKAAMEKSLCSIKPKQSDGAKAVVAEDPNHAPLVKAVVAVEAAEASSAVAVEAKAANRCFSCDRKVGLMRFNCKCGNTYCGTHRYSEKHNCTFDYKAVGREEIAKANPVVKADKVERI